jgi:hypothetical protein
MRLPSHFLAMGIQVAIFSSVVVPENVFRGLLTLGKYVPVYSLLISQLDEMNRQEQ